MSFLQNLTDDQTAILGCSVLLLVAFVTMSVSYHVGVIVRGARSSQHRSQPVPQSAVEVRRRAA